MALSIVDKPYDWTLRGQKLLYRIASTNTTQDGFKYGIAVTDVATGKIYQFFIDRSPSTSDLLFDLAPVVKMFNDESTPDLHTTGTDTPWSEPKGGSWKQFNLQFSEWWIVNGVLTDNEEYVQSTNYILNGYYQPSNGYKPNPNTGDVDIRLALTGVISSDSLAWSDRKYNTHTWWNIQGGLTNNSPNSTYIPCMNSDYGLLYAPLKTTLTGNAERIVVSLWSGGTPIGTDSFVPTGDEIIGVGVYPMNLNDSGLPSYVKPANNPTWTHYFVRFVSSLNTGNRSINYVFYDQEKTGQYDCRYNYVRLAWVNSRSGWDYFNFIKKNEVSNEFERKQYKRLLMNNVGTFDNWQRQLTDRETIVTQILTITSDWIQENEFVFLRNLFASNQVEILNTEIGSKSLGYRTPVSIIDTSFVEKKERNGKLYNITIKLKYSQDYWT